MNDIDTDHDDAAREDTAGGPPLLYGLLDETDAAELARRRERFAAAGRRFAD